MRTQDPPPSPWPPGTPRLRIGDVFVDLRYRQVRHGDTVTELPQRMFDLLQVFLAEPGALHTRADLFRRVWGDVVVEDSNLSQSVWMLRKALGPERKDWIRTVAKRGYVFAPPAAVEALPDETTAPPVPLVPAAAASPVADALPAAIAKSPRPRWWRFVAWPAAALALAAAGWGAVAWQGRDPAAPAAPQTTVALLEVHDRAAPGANWPADLAHAWLGWKLRSLPEVTVLGESDLAADTGRVVPAVVMLSCASGGPGEVVLRARFDDRRQPPIEVRGPVAQAPRLADELSRRTMARLLPQRARDRWPGLELDTPSARDFAKALDALERRDWSGSLPMLRKVVRQAPHFGLAQLELARAESNLGQAGPAVAAMGAARLNLRPLPADAQRLLDARALAIDPQRTNEAAAAYAALAKAWPQRADFALEHAGYLTSAGKPVEARAILQRPEWQQRRTGLRIARLQALAQTDAALGDLQGAKAHATQALALARTAGEGWSNERGSALVFLAQLESAQHSNHPDNPLYEEAAREFEAAGATADALYARVQRQLVQPPGKGSIRGVDTLLAKAHAEGYRRLEIELLRSIAYRHYQAGQLSAYRDLMEQALAAADSAGDLAQQRFFEIDLLSEDYLRGDFASAGRRIERLRKAGVQGAAAGVVRDYASMIAAMRGHYGQALALIDAGLRKAPETPALLAASTACSRADLLQQQGQLTRARALWTHCAAPDQDSLRMQARLGRASNDLLAGDRPAALAMLRDLAAQTRSMLSGPERWQMATNIAPLLLRAGDVDGAEALLAPILADVRKAGYGLVLAMAETGLAEVEAARGRWDTSRDHAIAARRAIPPDIWVITSRLDHLDIADALARGDRNRAEELLARSDANAHRNNDAIAQLELHGLMSPAARLPDGCDATARKALVARTGMRGASLDWLFGPLAARNPLWHTASAN